MKFIPGLLLIAAAFLMAALIARAADTQEPPTIQELEGRILQLEIHDCGLTQFEDYSLAMQKDDRARRMCVEYMRGAYKARYIDEQLLPRERPEG